MGFVQRILGRNREGDGKEDYNAADYELVKDPKTGKLVNPKTGKTWEEENTK